MKIVFRTEIKGDDYEPRERHTVLVDGKKVMSQADWICPEDVNFYRDLSSPHDCEDLIVKVINAVKEGEKITIEHETVEDLF